MSTRIRTLGRLYIPQNMSIFFKGIAIDLDCLFNIMNIIRSTIFCLRDP